MRSPRRSPPPPRGGGATTRPGPRLAVVAGLRYRTAGTTLAAWVVAGAAPDPPAAAGAGSASAGRGRRSLLVGADAAELDDLAAHRGAALRRPPRPARRVAPGPPPHRDTAWCGATPPRRSRPASARSPAPRAPPRALGARIDEATAALPHGIAALGTWLDPHRRLPAHDLLPVVEDHGLRRRPLRGLLAAMTGAILVVANNDLELLALRAAVEQLPDGFPAVRAYGGVGPRRRHAAARPRRRPRRARPAAQGPLGVGGAVRRPAPATCIARGVAAARLRWRGRSSTPSWPRSPPSPAGHRGRGGRATGRAAGPANLANLLRFVADTVAARGLRVRAAGRRCPRSACSATAPTTRPGPRSPSSPTGPTCWPATRCRSSSCATPSRPAAPTPGPVHCYSLRAGEPTAPSPRCSTCCATPTSSSPPRGPPAAPWPDGRRPGRAPAARAGPRRSTRSACRCSRPSWPPASAAALGGARRRALAPRRRARRRHPRVRRPDHRPGLRVQGGGRRRRRARRRRVRPPGRARPGRAGGRPGRAPRPPAAHRRRPTSGSRSCCPPTRPSAAGIGNAVALDTPASLLAVLDALRAAGYDVGDGRRRQRRA